MEVTNKYGKLLLPLTGSGYCHEYLMNGKVWEDDTIDFCLKNIKNKSIITAGTYVGDFIIAFSRVSKNVICFECEKNHINYTEHNIKLNNLTNIIFSPYALSDKAESLYLKYSADGWCADYKDSDRELGEMCFLKSKEELNTYKVNCIDLDTFFKVNNLLDEISIIQLDIEGYEMIALSGAKNLIIKNTPIIIVEDGPGNGNGNVFYDTFLKQLGYVYHETKIGERAGHLFFGNLILYIPLIHKLVF
jgi:FkbM family methyltransferase